MAAALETVIRKRRLGTWPEEVVQLCKPDDFHVSTGSQEKCECICETCVKHGTLVCLHESLGANWYLARACTSDVARAEVGTFSLTTRDEKAGLTNDRVAAAEHTDPARLPRILLVNRLGKGPCGHFLGPGYGENSRVPKWNFKPVEAKGAAVSTPTGHGPAPGALDLSGLDGGSSDLEPVLAVDVDEWEEEASRLGKYYHQSGDKHPAALDRQLAALRARLKER